MSDRQLSFDNIVGEQFAPVAQGTEQRPSKPTVGGSIPSGRMEREPGSLIPGTPASWEPPPPGPWWEKYFKSVSPRRPFVALASLIQAGTSQEKEYARIVGHPWEELPSDHPFVVDSKAKLTGNKSQQKEKARAYQV